MSGSEKPPLGESAYDAEETGSPRYDEDFWKTPAERGGAQTDEYDVDMAVGSGVDAPEEDLAFIGHWVHRDLLGSVPSPREVAQATASESEASGAEGPAELVGPAVSGGRPGSGPDSPSGPGIAALKDFRLGAWAEELEDAEEEHEVGDLPWAPRREKQWYHSTALLVVILILVVLAVVGSLVHMVLTASSS